MSAMGTYRGFPVDDPPWAAADYAELLATAQSMLATRRKRFPDWVREQRITQAEADAEIATFQAIAAHWRWICTGEGEPAHLATLTARQDALDASLDTIAQIAREKRGLTPNLALQAEYVLALRWYAALDRELGLIRCTRLTREIRTRLNASSPFMSSEVETPASPEPVEGSA